MPVLQTLNLAFSILFFLCYAYQFFYIPVALLPTPRRKPAQDTEPSEKPHRFAVLIAARNEEAVLGQLLESIARQDWPADRLTAFVVADNCTDGTAAVARQAGAVVYERYNTEQVGKGYALDELLQFIARDWGSDAFDGYFVFDADNLLEPDYVRQMDRTFRQGYRVITSYRNSKNYGDNWISAGYALWFLREARYLNRPRMRLGCSCAVSGTGFFFSREVLSENGGWPFHLLTEDIEFTVDRVLRGEKIGYCEDAVFYDEQPTSFRQSWRQRLRWAKGYLQVFRRYGFPLLWGTLRGRFSCFDMTMAILPAIVLTLASTAVNLTAAILGTVTTGSPGEAVLAVLSLCATAYLTLFFLGTVTLASEWKRIYAPTYKKLLSALTFPLFMLTYAPISLAALFCRVTWKPITHKKSLSLSQIRPKKSA